MSFLKGLHSKSKFLAIGLTVGGTGLITAGLSVSNLTGGLSGNLIMGGNLLGGTAGDIYL